MKEKDRFVICAIAMTLVSVALGVYLLVRFEIESDGIAIFNLWVDIIVGIFTVWGLKWAASEFAESAVKPVLRLLPGEGKRPSAFKGMEKFSLIRNPPFHVSGRDRRPLVGAPAMHVPHIVCGLYLDNEKSKAGRYVRVVIRILATPEPTYCEFVHGPFSAESKLVPGEKDPDTGYLTVQVQFAEELVVYQSPVFVGDLTVDWDTNLPNGKFPKSVIFDYDVYTLDGASHKKLELLVEWGNVSSQN